MLTGLVPCRRLSPPLFLCPYSGTVTVSLCPGPRVGSTPSGSSSASKPYSWRECMPFSGLAPLVPSDCRGRGPALSSSSAISLGRGGAAVLGPRALQLLTPSDPLSALAQVVWGLPSPPRPLPSSPVTLSPSVATPGVSSPRGNVSTPGVLMPCDDSTPPPTPWRSPWGFQTLRRPRGILRIHSLRRAWSPLRRPASPSFASHYIGLACRVFPSTGYPLPCLGSFPMAPPPLLPCRRPQRWPSRFCSRRS